MFLTGCRTVDELRKVPIFITGTFKDWLELRGYDIVKFCRMR